MDGKTNTKLAAGVGGTTGANAPTAASSSTAAADPDTAAVTALQNYLTLVHEFKTDLDSFGRRQIPVKWKLAEDALTTAKKLLTDATNSKGSTSDADAATILFDRLDRLELAEQNISQAKAAVCDPNVLAESSQMMSQDFSNKLKYRVASLETAKRKTDDRLRECIRAAPAIEQKNLIAAFNATTRGGLSTDLYVSIMGQDGSAEGAAALQATKSTVLGSTTDSVTISPKVSADDVTYNYLPLITRPEVASTVTGLSYKLVRHLRTIGVADAKSASDVKSPSIAVPERIIAYNACVEAVVASVVPSLASGPEAAAALLADYESVRATLEPKLVCDADPLYICLDKEYQTEFASRFGKTPPTSSREYAEFVIPAEIENSYITRAVAAVFMPVLEKAILRPLHMLVTPLAPYMAARAEAHITQMIQILSLSRAIRIALGDAFAGAFAPSGWKAALTAVVKRPGIVAALRINPTLKLASLTTSR